MSILGERYRVRKTIAATGALLSTTALAGCASGPDTFSGNHLNAMHFLKDQYKTHKIHQCIGTSALKIGGHARISPDTHDKNAIIVEAEKDQQYELTNPQLMHADGGNAASSTWYVARLFDSTVRGLVVFVNKDAVADSRLFTCNTEVTSEAGLGDLSLPGYQPANGN